MNHNATAAAVPGYKCPISHELFEDPVIWVADGHTYEQYCISEWLKANNTSPMTGEVFLASTRGAKNATLLVPNHSMRANVKEWKEYQQNNSAAADESNLQANHTAAGLAVSTSGGGGGGGSGGGGGGQKRASPGPAFGSPSKRASPGPRTGKKSRAAAAAERGQTTLDRQWARRP
jgi:hypothetical protein